MLHNSCPILVQSALSEP